MKARKILLLFFVIIMIISNIAYAQEENELPDENCQDLKFYQIWSHIKCSFWDGLNKWIKEKLLGAFTSALSPPLKEYGDQKVFDLMKGIAYSLIGLMVIYSAYLFMFAGSIGDDINVTIHNAKMQLLKALFLGFAIMIVPYLLQLLRQEIIDNLVKDVLNFGGADAGISFIVSGITAFFLISSPAFPVTWSIGIGLILIFLIAIVIRVMILHVLLTLMPIILFLYFFNPTKKYGKSLMEMTILNIVFPFIWAVMIVVFSTVGDAFGPAGGILVAMASLLILPLCAGVYFAYGIPGLLGVVTGSVGGAVATGMAAKTMARSVGQMKGYGSFVSSVNRRIGDSNIPYVNRIKLPEVQDKTYQALRQQYGEHLTRMTPEEFKIKYAQTHKNLGKYKEITLKSGVHHEVHDTLEGIKTRQEELRKKGIVPMTMDASLTKDAVAMGKEEHGHTWDLLSPSERNSYVERTKRNIVSGSTETARDKPIRFNFGYNQLKNAKDFSEKGISHYKLERFEQLEKNGRLNDYLNFNYKTNPKFSDGIKNLDFAHSENGTPIERDEAMINGINTFNEIKDKDFGNSIKNFTIFEKHRTKHSEIEHGKLVKGEKHDKN